ncbi:hypothetical protein D3C72_2448700 [compost metagenome]
MVAQEADGAVLRQEQQEDGHRDEVAEAREGPVRGRLRNPALHHRFLMTTFTDAREPAFTWALAS